MRQWLAAALAVTVVACAAPSRPTLGAAPDVDAALDARLFPPYYGSVPVQLSKPAYVALFEVVPGRGVSLLYPQAGAGWQATVAQRIAGTSQRVGDCDERIAGGCSGEVLIVVGWRCVRARARKRPRRLRIAYRSGTGQVGAGLSAFGRLIGSAPRTDSR